MGAYESLALLYDDFTRDVPYTEFADFYERVFGQYGRSPRIILDLACGTGTMTYILAERGYEMIGADASPEMLAVAAEKAGMLPECVMRPLFLCQSMEEIDLFGTVDAVVCTLDGLNYIPHEALPEVFKRISLFIEPDGILIFDNNMPYALRSLDGEVFIDETDDAYCVWRAEWDETSRSCNYGLDIFKREGSMWSRSFEEHTEYAHEPNEILSQLEASGFEDVKTFGGADAGVPGAGKGRLFFSARKGR